MKNIFLTSDMGLSKKINGIRYAKSINNENHIIELLKDKINKEETFVMIASSPDSYEVNDSYGKITFDSFNKSGFNFKEFVLVDYRYEGDLKNDIEKADIVFLSGGHTPTEMAYFEKINLRELLKDYEGVIIGQSAGSINLASIAVCAPEYEEEIGTNYVWKGLGKTKINIEPHFTLKPDEILLREELLKLSEQYPIYAICDGTHVYDDGQEAKIYGEAYYLNGDIKKICDVKQTYNINDEKVRNVK